MVGEVRRRNGGGRARYGFALLAVFVLQALVPAFLPTARAPIVSYTLFGKATLPSGWAFTSGAEANPGPTLFADEGDTVSLTLTKDDIATHFWFLDYDGSGSFTAGEPRSPNITTNTPYSFLADRAGVFSYRCGVHVNGMRGTFQINATFPVATLLQPAGGLSWTGGSAHDVNWTMTDPQSPVTALVAYLNYSYAAGTQTGTIAGPLPGTTNPHTQAWTVPAVDAADMLVNLTVVDPDGHRAYSTGLVPTVDSTPPAVSSINPADLAVNVALTAPIQITFSERMDTASTLAALTVVPSIALTPAWSGGNTVLTLTHATLFSASTLYTVTIAGTARDASDPGNALAPFASSFTTGNPAPLAAIQAPDGLRQWTGGSTHDVNWTMTDDSPLPSLNAWLNYSSSAGGGAIGGPIAGSTNPHSAPWVVPLVDVADMLVNLTVRDPNGGVAYAEAFVPLVDSTAPSVMAVNPTNNSIGISVSTAIDLTFDEPMNQATAESAVALYRLPAWTPVAVSIQGWTGNVLTVLPSALLSPSTNYALNVTAAATDASDPGNPGAFFSSEFTTGGAPPLVGLTAPVGGESWSGGSSHGVSWTLSDVDTPLSSVTLCLYESQTGPTGPWSLVSCFAGDTVPPFAYTAPAANTTAAHLRLTANDTLSEAESISGAFEIDNARPSLVSRTPIPGTLNVPLNANVVHVFTEPMDLPSATAAFGLQQQPSLQWVAGALTWTGSDTLTFDPTVDLLPSTTYFVWMNQSAHDDSDPGNVLDAGYIWQFTTGTAADTTAPTVSDLLALPDPALPGMSVNITANVTDNVGLATVLLRVTLGVTEVVNQTMSAGPAVSWYHDQSYAATGTYAFTITATDTSGNPATATAQFTVVPPLTLTSPQATPSPAEFANPVNVSAVVSSAFSGVQVWIGGPGIGNSSAAFDGGSGRYFRSVTPAVLGTHAFTVWATDASGAWASLSGTFLVEDTTPPVVTATATPPVQVAPLAVNLTATVSDSFTDSVNVTIDGIGTFPMILAAGTWSYEATVAVGVYFFNITANDTTGNAGTAGGTFTIVPAGTDVTPPEIAHTPPATTLDTFTAFPLDVTITDAGGLAAANLTYTDTRGLTTTVDFVPPGPAFTATIPGQIVPGTVTYRFEAIDTAGNANATSTFSVAIVLSYTPPALWGEADSGWGSLPTTITQPGPTLVFNASESVSLTVIGIDDQFHLLFIDVNGNGVLDTNEPRSGTVRGNATAFAFAAPGTAGNYTYYCGVHPDLMSGTLRVLGSGGGPGPNPQPPPVLLYFLLIAAVIAGVVILVVLRMRRKKPSTEESPEEKREPEERPPEDVGSEEHES